MVEADISRYTLDELRRMKAAGSTRPTPDDAPEIELLEEFWHRAKIVPTMGEREPPEADSGSDS